MNNPVVIISAIFLIFFLFHSARCYKEKKINYTFRFSKINVLNPNNFFKIQIIFSILNCISLLILLNIYIFLQYRLELYLILYCIIFWLYNLSIKYISLKLNYIEIND